MASSETANVFVGSDRSQLLAVKVLEHSINRHTDLNVVVHSMHGLDLPDPKDIRQGKRTGFSFSRFAIPQLMEYRGKAMYLDADMLVFRDFREVWDIPFNGAKIVIQEDPEDGYRGDGKAGAPKKRVRQSAVMLLDCAALDWDPLEIIAGLDGEYVYDDLLVDICILDETEVSYAVPFEWNSLETFEPGKTGLVHYTDMHTQPWVHAGNANGYLWLEEVRMMLGNRTLALDELEVEVRSGYFRPSLLVELAEAGDGPAPPVTPEQVRRYDAIDRDAGYIRHAGVYRAKRIRARAVRDYEAQLVARSGPAAVVVHGAGLAIARARNGLGGLLSAVKRRLAG